MSEVHHIICWTNDLTRRIHAQRKAPFRHIRRRPGNHHDAVDNRADAEAQSAARAAVSDRRQVGLGIKLDSLEEEINGFNVNVAKVTGVPICVRVSIESLLETYVEAYTVVMETI